MHRYKKHHSFQHHLHCIHQLFFSISGFPLQLRNLKITGSSSLLVKGMGFNMFLVVCVVISCSTAFAQTSPPSPPLSPTPAPAPAPEYVNLTELLTVAGPFSTFLSYLEKTKVIEIFQNQANNTDEGITIFVPKNSAFSSQKNPSLANLTSEQLKQLCLFHALPHYYSLAEFKNLSILSPVSTFAGGAQYALNFSDDSGTVRINSGWTKTKVSSSVYSTDPVALYQVDKVLLPTAIFGTDIPPTAAPAPAPEGPVADSPNTSDKGTSPPGSPGNSGFKSASWGVMTQMSVAISGLIIMSFL